jgi:hypothetical protein
MRTHHDAQLERARVERMKQRNRLAAERARRQAELERENATCAAVLVYQKEKALAEERARLNGRTEAQFLAARAIWDAGRAR